MFNFRQMLETSGRNILVVGLNPCLDVTISVPRLETGATNYYDNYHENLGGKGSNVVRAIHALGGSGSIFSPEFPEDGSKVSLLMQKEGINAYLVNLPGHLRVNYKVLDVTEAHDVRMTELNSPGMFIAEVAVRLLEREWLRQIEQDQLLVLSGSLIPGMPIDTYHSLITAQHERGGRVVLDAKGDAMKAALAAKPDLVKPNRDELIEATGMPCDTMEGVIEAMLKLREMGADVVLCSLGDEGAVITRGGAIYHAPAPQNRKILRLAGAGDAMAAVLACFASRDDDLTDDELPDVLIWAMAASQAAISHDGLTMPSLEEAEDWVDQIEVRQLR